MVIHHRPVCYKLDFFPLSSFVATCKCPKEFRTTWYHFPPYISFDNGTVGGFIPQILELAVQACCSDCTGPNGKSISTVNFELDGKGNAARKPGVKDLISSIDARTDLSVPMIGYELQTHYSLYRYVKLAESPGVAFITVTEASKKAVAIANMFFYSWPLLILAFLMTLLAGIIMSFLVSEKNSIECLPRGPEWVVQNMGRWRSIMSKKSVVSSISRIRTQLSIN